MIKNWETCILEAKENGVAILTFNRPKQLNAISEQLSIDLLEACTEVTKNNDIQALINDLEKLSGVTAQYLEL